VARLTTQPVRAVLAGGPVNGSSPAMVIDAAVAGAPVVDGTMEPASLIIDRLPRARLLAGQAAHDVLVLPAVDRNGGAGGVQRVEVVVDGWRFEVDLEPEARAQLRERARRAGAEQESGGPAELRAIIPGRIVSVDVAEGDSVEDGQRVLVVEAMKMQNELRAPRQGRIARINVQAGQTVELGDVLVVVE
jgi:biotin carboxyl carrier protein